MHAPPTANGEWPKDLKAKESEQLSPPFFTIGTRKESNGPPSTRQILDLGKGLRNPWLAMWKYDTAHGCTASKRPKNWISDASMRKAQPDFPCDMGHMSWSRKYLLS